MRGAVRRQSAYPRMLQAAMAPGAAVSAYAGAARPGGIEGRAPLGAGQGAIALPGTEVCVHELPGHPRG